MRAVVEGYRRNCKKNINGIRSYTLTLFFLKMSKSTVYLKVTRVHQVVYTKITH
jgi:hypothetical protein